MKPQHASLATHLLGDIMLAGESVQHHKLNWFHVLLLFRNNLLVKLVWSWWVRIGVERPRLES